MGIEEMILNLMKTSLVVILCLPVRMCTIKTNSEGCCNIILSVTMVLIGHLSACPLTLRGLVANKGFSDVLEEWMGSILTNYPDVYFVNELQVIQWMQSPTPVSALRDFIDWQSKCNVGGQPFCQLPNECPLATRELPGETLRLHTCIDCPRNYPWLQDPTGNGFSF